MELTDSTVGGATMFPKLLGQVSEPVERVTADGGYDRGVRTRWLQLAVRTWPCPLERAQSCPEIRR